MLACLGMVGAMGVVENLIALVLKVLNVGWIVTSLEADQEYMMMSH